MLKFAKFIGANTDFATAQAFLFPRVYPEGSNDPIFGLVISGEGEDIFVFVRQKILSLEEEFNSSFERVTDKLHELLEVLKTEFSQIENLKLTLFCARDNIFYVLQKGQNLVEIFSEGERLPVVSQGFPQEKIISGFIKSNDRILVLSARADGSSWSDDVISQVFKIPLQSVDDAEVIFAKDEQEEEEQDLAGIKNIQPVAFVLIENESEDKPDLPTETEKQTKKQFKVKIELAPILLGSRKIIRETFGILRKTNEQVLQANKKAVIAVAVITFVAISVFGAYWYFQSKQSEKNTRRDNLITLVETSLDKAVSLKDSDTKGATQELNKASDKLKELESLDPKNQRVKDTRGKFESKSAEVLKIYKDFELELFMSLDLIKENFHTKRFSFSVNKILLLDENEKSLVSVGIELKSPDILAGRTQLGDGKVGVINGSNAFVYSPDKGISHIDLDTNKLSIVSSPDSGWGKIEDIFSFSGNVYVLDSGNSPEGGMIWKYAPIKSGFSQKQEYLKGRADLSRGKRLAIDYSVWVLTDQPDILKFTAGNSDFYAISGLNKPLTQIDGIFVTEDLDRVFILDKSSSRILATKKNGEYLEQYVKGELSKVDDFFVDEEGKQIYLLIENKIYKTSLKS